MKCARYFSFTFLLFLASFFVFSSAVFCFPALTGATHPSFTDVCAGARELSKFPNELTANRAFGPLL